MPSEFGESQVWLERAAPALPHESEHDARFRKLVGRNTNMINIEEVKRYLPHRYPFLMIDRVLHVEAGKYVVALKNVTANEPYFNGHFPAEAVMPGVMIIEAMAQAAGILALMTEGREVSDDYLYLLCGLSNTRFRQKVMPGDQLELHATLVKAKRNILKFHCEAKVDGKEVAKTDLLVAEQTLEQK